MHLRLLASEMRALPSPHLHELEAQAQPGVRVLEALDDRALLGERVGGIAVGRALKLYLNSHDLNHLRNAARQ